MDIKFNFDLARPEQINAICELVNVAYRGEQGWTTETDIVQGNRTTDTEIKLLMSSPDAYLLVATNDNTLLACVGVEKKAGSAFIGLLAVHPGLQGKGLGKYILELTEKYAVTNLKINKFVMLVVSQRPELIAFYERRGYVRTGAIQAYPVHLNVGLPRVAGLTVEYFEKQA